MFKKKRTQAEWDEIVRAHRAKFIKHAANWHGYVPKPTPVAKIESHPDYLLPEVKIPKALHVQYRLVGEERSRGRRRRE